MSTGHCGRSGEDQRRGEPVIMYTAELCVLLLLRTRWLILCMCRAGEYNASECVLVLGHESALPMTAF
jgi:hypothetical protein